MGLIYIYVCVCVCVCVCMYKSALNRKSVAEAVLAGSERSGSKTHHVSLRCKEAFCTSMMSNVQKSQVERV